MPKVLAVTTSMGTKWEAYSQGMLWRLVPEWRRKVIDGTRNWSPTGFIPHVADEDVDYIVHVDEDCFVQSREGLLDVIDELERCPEIVAAGVPDGGHYYRSLNPAALNLFFVVFRASALRRAWSGRERWVEHQFRSEYASEVLKRCPWLDDTKINWDECEPYYPLYWSLLASGGRFLYLGTDLSKERWSSIVLGPSGQPVAEHMWYLRNWFTNEVMPGHDVPNVERYAKWEEEWHSIYGNSFLSNLVIQGGHVKRLLRRLLRKAT